MLRAVVAVDGPSAETTVRNTGYALLLEVVTVLKSALLHLGTVFRQLIEVAPVLNR